MSGISRLLLLALFSLTSAEDYLDCLKNYSVLEQAVLETADNRFNIIRAFYSPDSTSPSFYVKVNYVSMVNNEINETWLWTKAPIYFIEPPSIFQFTSLLFNHHDISKQVYSLEVLLPSACCNVSASSCFNKDNNTKYYVNNRYLGVLTNELYLYAQYNGKNARIVLEDVPSISLPYMYNTHCPTIDERSIHLYYSLCVILPLLLLFLALVIFQSCRPHIRKLLKQPSRGKNFNQNFSALLLTGIVFSFYVVICDSFACIYTFRMERLGMLDHYVSKDSADDSKYTILTIAIIDSVATFYSLINLVLVSYSSIHSDGEYSWSRKFITCYSYLFHCLCLCRKYAKVECKDNKFDYSIKESLLWLLLASFAGPLICIGTHSSFVIMAWSSDPIQARSMVIIFILSFLYHFLGLRQLYVMLISCTCICKSTPSSRIAKERNSDEDSIKLESLTDSAGNGYEDKSTLIEKQDQAGDKEESTPEKQDQHSIDSDLQKHHKNLQDFNFVILLIELPLLLLLMGIEALIIATYFLLPAPVTDVPHSILNTLNLSIIIAGALISYKLFQFEAPIERTLLQSFVKSCSGGNKDSDEYAEEAGKMLGKALKKMMNKTHNQSSPQSTKKDVGSTSNLNKSKSGSSTTGKTVTLEAEVYDATDE